MKKKKKTLVFADNKTHATYLVASSKCEAHFICISPFNGSVKRSTGQEARH